MEIKQEQEYRGRGREGGGGGGRRGGGGGGGGGEIVSVEPVLDVA